MFAENFVGLGWVGFLVVCSLYIKSIPTHGKLYAVGKKWPKCYFHNLFFLGLLWPWVGQFVGFIIILTCFPTQHNLVNRKTPYYPIPTVVPWNYPISIIRVFGILKHYYKKPTNSPTQGQPNPRKKRLKVAFGPLFPTAKQFFVGWNLCHL